MKQISHTILLMFIIINISCTNASAAALNDNKDTAIQDKNQQEDTITEGWVKTKSETCFFRNGEKQTGWCRIANKYYTDEQKDLPINHAAVTLPLSAANVFLHTE